MSQISIDAPIRLRSEMNLREHWSKRHQRFSAHRETVRRICTGSRVTRASLSAIAGHLSAGGRVVVTLTRYGPKLWDRHDNLTSGAKAVVDEIAALLQVDDGDARLAFVYRQEIAKTHSLRIEIEEAT